MPKVIIDGREIEVEAGTNLIEAGARVGIQIPHYCYHPRLSVVGQCRMCLVKVEGLPKLQTACTTQVVKDGMVVKVDDPEVREAQEGIMEFLLINHPLDCPICDQAGECGLQDYSFKHGQAFSRFAFEEKRTYPGRERIPLGPHVLLNMNRCIQCTRCIRFTQEISGTGELGFFQRGARTEIGVFPGRQLDNELSTCVVDVCPVGALTSTRFRFAERVWYLDKKPSLCTGCDVGCNITLEHRRGAIRRYKPRFNPQVNDYWMCDHGRGSWERYEQLPRLTAPRLADDGGPRRAVGWQQALGVLEARLRAIRAGGSTMAMLGSAHLSTEEAFLAASLAELVGSPNVSVWSEEGPERFIPNLHGGVRGRETGPNRRGAELAGLAPTEEATIGATDLLEGEAAAGCDLLLILDSAFGSAADDPETVARLRQAGFLVVLGWADTALARAADLALPTTTHAESAGTYVNVAHRLQAYEPAFPAPGEARPASSVLCDLLSRFDKDWKDLDLPEIFERLGARRPVFAGVDRASLPAEGIGLELQATGAEAGG